MLTDQLVGLYLGASEPRRIGDVLRLLLRRRDDPPAGEVEPGIVIVVGLAGADRSNALRFTQARIGNGLWNDQSGRVRSLRRPREQRPATSTASLTDHQLLTDRELRFECASCDAGILESKAETRPSSLSASSTRREGDNGAYGLTVNEIPGCWLGWRKAGAARLLAGTLRPAANVHCRWTCRNAHLGGRVGEREIEQDPAAWTTEICGVGTAALLPGRTGKTAYSEARLLRTRRQAKGSEPSNR